MKKHIKSLSTTPDTEKSHKNVIHYEFALYCKLYILQNLKNVSLFFLIYTCRVFILLQWIIAV